MMIMLIYSISIYLLVGMLMGLNSFSVDKQHGTLSPIREYSVRIPLFWLIDIINQVFFSYYDQEGDFES